MLVGLFCFSENAYATEKETTIAPHLFDCFIYIPNFYV